MKLIKPGIHDFLKELHEIGYKFLVGAHEGDRYSPAFICDDLSDSEHTLERLGKSLVKHGGSRDARAGFTFFSKRGVMAGSMIFKNGGYMFTHRDGDVGEALNYIAMKHAVIAIRPERH